MSSQNETTGRLTTHVLDTASGKPAANHPPTLGPDNELCAS